MSDVTGRDDSKTPLPADARLHALRARVRDIEDFPKPGILFRDLTPLMGHGPSMRMCVDLLGERVARHKPDVIVAVESRGFIFGAPVAAALGVAGCQSGSGGQWWRFGKHDTASASSLVSAPTHKPSLPSSMTTPSSLASTAPGSGGSAAAWMGPGPRGAALDPSMAATSARTPSALRCRIAAGDITAR